MHGFGWVSEKRKKIEISSGYCYDLRKYLKFEIRLRYDNECESGSAWFFFLRGIMSERTSTFQGKQESSKSREATLMSFFYSYGPSSATFFFRIVLRCVPAKGENFEITRYSYNFDDVRNWR